MKKLVIFDLDGTLIDSYEGIKEALNYAVRKFGKRPWGLKEVKKRVGRGLEILMEEALGKEYVEEGVKLFREKYAKIFLKRTKILPFVKETIEYLYNKNILLAIASNKPSDFTRRIMEGFGLSNHFKAIYGPFEVEKLKPEPEMIFKILDNLKVDKKDALYVGDMVLDAETAKNAQIDCILVSTGGNTIKELKSTGFSVVNNLKEIIKIGGFYDP